MSEGSLAKKVRTAYAQDAAFARSHRMVTWMMAFWAFTVIVDRGIGMLTNAYEQTSAVFPLAGAAILLLIAFLGTQGHLTLALLFLELNMAVFLIHFAASCFFYKETAVLYDVSYSQVYSWVKKYDSDGEEGLVDKRGHHKIDDEVDELERLRRENVRLKRQLEEKDMAVELLKKVKEFGRM